MAEIIENPTWMPGGNRASYPWDEWLDGSARILRRGEDFPMTSTPASVRNTAYRHAHYRALKLRTVISDETLQLQAYKPAGSR